MFTFDKRPLRQVQCVVCDVLLYVKSLDRRLWSRWHGYDLHDHTLLTTRYRCPQQVHPVLVAWLTRTWGSLSSMK